MADLKKFILNWEGPFDPYAIDQVERAQTGDGIYMFVEGKDPLLGIPRGVKRPLYIGKVESTSFVRRINQHLNSKVGDWMDWKAYHDVTVKLASIEPITTKKVSPSNIKWIENLLIVETAPTKCDTSYKSYNGDDIEIENIGKYWPLKSTYSTLDYE